MPALFYKGDEIYVLAQKATTRYLLADDRRK